MSYIIPVKCLFDDRGLFGLRFVRRLSDDEVKKLEHMRRNEVGRVSQRAHMILLSNRRFCVVRISKISGTREATIRRWIERFEQEGIDSLCDRPRSGRLPKVAAAVLPIIERMYFPPRHRMSMAIYSRYGQQSTYRFTLHSNTGSR